jgi:hypothetical protein
MKNVFTTSNSCQWACETHDGNPAIRFKAVVFMRTICFADNPDECGSWANNAQPKPHGDDDAELIWPGNL